MAPREAGGEYKERREGARWRGFGERACGGNDDNDNEPSVLLLHVEIPEWTLWPQARPFCMGLGMWSGLAVWRAVGALADQRARSLDAVEDEVEG